MWTLTGTVIQVSAALSKDVAINVQVVGTWLISFAF